MRFVGIDPATKTGFVALNEQGSVEVEVELIGKGRKEPGGLTAYQLVSLENQIYRLLQPGDIIAIEEPAYGTNMGVTTGMIHGGLRTMIIRRQLDYFDVNPNYTKSFVNSNRRAKEGEDKKKIIAAAVLAHYGYKHGSDNVTDAFIIAHIAKGIYEAQQGSWLEDYLPYQREVITKIVKPPPKESKKPKQKSNKRRGKPAAADSHTHLTEQPFLF
ncbi:hypothetical protein FRY98_24685 [Paenibacillus faecis]|uniref:Uncharacterized protein n=1 Tax=Paenibacillus faecis TaxID=862114 RepID=A0A5D0CLY6_9BACL|nr:hypothetical protein [Paenibacillus faecis]TYA10966.1 hypothetical protein FRY98_24685 [Paenibacillus faecis]